jgi:hypothetical protein
MEPEEFFQKLYEIVNTYKGSESEKESMDFCASDLQELLDDKDV